jgi:hypothetical protein
MKKLQEKKKLLVERIYIEEDNNKKKNLAEKKKKTKGDLLNWASSSRSQEESLFEAKFESEKIWQTPSPSVVAKMTGAKEIIKPTRVRGPDIDMEGGSDLMQILQMITEARNGNPSEGGNNQRILDRLRSIVDHRQPSARVESDPEKVKMLVEMGFPEERAK